MTQGNPGMTLEVKVCRGMDKCRRAVANGAALAAWLREIGGSGPAADAEAAHAHKRFRVAVSCCPNGCSQPQIVDFGLSGTAAPVVTEAECLGCGGCLEQCREDAIRLEGDPPRPVIDRNKCLGCGDCVAACPSNTLKAGPTRWRVMVGGRLGRHPALAEVLPGAHTDAAVLTLFRAVLAIREGGGSRRFRDILDSGTGLAELRRLAGELSRDTDAQP